MNETAKRTNAWLWLTTPIAVLLAVAAGGGLFIEELMVNHVGLFS